jgi:IS1 family transposase
MGRLGVDDLLKYDASSVSRMSREELMALALQALDLARRLANQVDGDSSNSSRPPSSDSPYKGQALDDLKHPASSPDVTAGSAAGKAGGGPKGNKAAKPKRPGKQPGMKGFWRSQPIVANVSIDHVAPVCGSCGASLTGLDLPRRCVGAHHVLELERDPGTLRVRAEKHSYFAVTCGCGVETAQQPGAGACASYEGRKRDLQLSERCLVGPMLAVFIAALALRCHMSRRRIKEFLDHWLGLDLGTATINRCIHELGLASEPVVEKLIEEVQAADIVHVDETPWYQNGVLGWLWVVVTARAVIFRVGDRSRETLVSLIGDAFVGWMVTDGYRAYRDYARRQRCLAHLIRKAVALMTGHYPAEASQFGHDLQRDLRRLIQRVADGDPPASIKRLLGKIKWTCQQNRYEIEDKVRTLAREILNDWDAVIAFVFDPLLPPTNNEAERALRHAVIFRRICYGTRTNEGSRFYAASMTVIETCRKRGVDPWTYARNLIANARKGQPAPCMP